MSTRPGLAKRRPVSPGLPGQRYLFFVGKGGVGKTTAACSAAMTLLERAKSDERIYLFSTDPAHSLSDSLAKPIGCRTMEVARNRRARLYACEIDPAEAFERFKSRYGAAVAETVELGTFLDKVEIDEFLGLSFPGLDEAAALFELSDLAERGEYTRIVVDTAPGGHTQRLLELPEVFSNWLAAVDALGEKHRYMVLQLTGRRDPDKNARLLMSLSRKVALVKELLCDNAQCAFIMVASPEPLVRDETIRYVEFLEQRHLGIAGLLINRVEAPTGNCEYCHARALAQAPILRELSRRFGGLKQVQVPLFPGAIAGFNLLRSFAGFAWGKASGPRRVREIGAKQYRQAMQKRPRRVAATFEIESDKVLIFGGKGGVGKTTAASAAALALAERFPASAVLVLSTDPAHSLSDSIGEPIGELKKGLAGMANLDGMEIDAAARFAALRERYEGWVDDLFVSLTSSSRWTVEFDGEATKKLVAMAPPGIDEMLGLSTIAGLLQDRVYQSIVIDTAPSGHLLRLLELPEIALSWVRTLLKLVLKYKQILHRADLARELLSLSRSIRNTLSLLRDPSRAEFVGVAIPEEMSLEESERLYKQLSRLDIPIHRLLINNVIPEESSSRCDFCAGRRSEQDQVLRSYCERFQGLKIFVAAQRPRPVQGPRRLRQHFRGWSLIKGT